MHVFWVGGIYSVASTGREKNKTKKNMKLSSVLLHERFTTLKSCEIVRYSCSCNFHSIHFFFSGSAINITPKGHGLKSRGFHRSVKIHILFTEFARTIVTVVNTIQLLTIGHDVMSIREYQY